MGDNAIDPDYASLFLPSNENSSENIFSMQYLQDLAGNAMPQHAFPVKDGGWCLINVAAGLFEAYQSKTVRRSVMTVRYIIQITWAKTETRVWIIPFIIMVPLLKGLFTIAIRILRVRIR